MILLKADAGWTDEKIAALVECTTSCVVVVRKHFVQCGLKKRWMGYLESHVDGFWTAIRKRESSRCALASWESSRAWGVRRFVNF
ncbi:MAG: hypothetical protein Q4D38_06415 [Planctomycetia bacterium]|nr:hypothetical protein [Planctomycetia bacterium]